MRLILVDDAVLFRRGLASLLGDAGHEVVREQGDATDLAAAVASEKPDVVVLDIRMPPTYTSEGLVAALALRSQDPSVGVLVLSQHVETTHAVGLLAGSGGGIGYLLKDRVGEVRELVDALQRIASGGTVIDPEVVRPLMAHTERAGRLDRLTDREREVLARMAEGRSNSAICRELFLGAKTVETYVSNIFAKFDLPPASDDHRRVLAVLVHLRG